MLTYEYECVCEYEYIPADVNTVKPH